MESISDYGITHTYNNSTSTWGGDYTTTRIVYIYDADCSPYTEKGYALREDEDIPERYRGFDSAKVFTHNTKLIHKHYPRPEIRRRLMVGRRRK